MKHATRTTENSKITVKMDAGTMQATVSEKGLFLDDIRGESPRMITMTTLEDALLVARAILAFAVDIDWEAESAEEAKWDALSAHFDFD